MQIVECEYCGSWTAISEPLRNTICPTCRHQGSLFVQTELNDMQKKALKERE